ncbi:lipase 3-like [Temnothorax nylanderi]|uniref:lipase 3-like n=1 Tax=Temnothorax nylanderi TaxID=102681 RepID=UPI003A83E545
MTMPLRAPNELSDSLHIFHEIGTKDLPAMFDYILNYTKQKDLYYIGHSMGNAALLILLSSKPEYNIKIKCAICLAPTSFWLKASPAVNEFANILPTFKEVLRKREIYDVFPQSLATVTVGRMLCNDNIMTQFICATILFIIAGPDSAQLNTTTLPDIFSYPGNQSDSSDTSRKSAQENSPKLRQKCIISVIERYIFHNSVALRREQVSANRKIVKVGNRKRMICPKVNARLFVQFYSRIAMDWLPGYFPAGSSVQTLEHFYQNIRIKDFRNYDYGIAENYKRYKQETPPSYNLKKITAPIILFYSGNDVIVLEENVLELGKSLPNVLLTEEVSYKLFNHLDFLWAINAKTLLYDRVLELLQKFDAG